MQLHTLSGRTIGLPEALTDCTAGEVLDHLEREHLHEEVQELSCPSSPSPSHRIIKGTTILRRQDEMGSEKDLRFTLIT